MPFALFGLQVLATLKLEFAATTALALGMADMIKKPLIRVGKPQVETMMDKADELTVSLGKPAVGIKEKAGNWIVPAIDLIIRVVAISAAWYLQTIISAFYSALRGGKMFAEGFFGILVDQAKLGIVLCPGVVGIDYDPEDSILDDVIGWILAAQGFMYQFSNGFALTGVWAILLAPISAFELYLKIQISGAVLSGGDNSASAGRRMSDDILFPQSVVMANATCNSPSVGCWCTMSSSQELTCLSDPRGFMG